MNTSFHWPLAATSVALKDPLITTSRALPARSNRKNFECAMPCRPRQDRTHFTSLLRIAGLRLLLPLCASARCSRLASRFRLSGFALPRSMTTRTITCRLWARISASTIPRLRMFQLATRIFECRGVLLMVRIRWCVIASRCARSPSGLFVVTPAGGV